VGVGGISRLPRGEEVHAVRGTDHGGDRRAEGDGREAPAAARNREPIAAVLLPLLPQGASVLEIASGTGEHAVHMAAARPDIHWPPSDPDINSRHSIAAWIDHTGLANVAMPLDLDVRRRPWPVDGFDLILCCNMIHIAPWASAVAWSARIAS